MNEVQMNAAELKAAQLTLEMPGSVENDVHFMDGLKTTGKGRKVTNKRVKLADINPRFEANNRNKVGDTFFGERVVHDTYDVNTLVEQIKMVGDILTPLEGVVLEGGKIGLNKGRRRYLAACWISDNLAGSDPELVRTMQTIPVMVFEGYTDRELALTNNDQQSKTYTKSEVYADFTKQLRAGTPWKQLGMLQMESLASVGFGRIRPSEVANLTKDKRDAAIKSWLTSTVEQTLYYSCMSGNRIYDLYGKALAKLDGIIAIDPEVNLLGSMPAQKPGSGVSRIKAANKAVREDRVAGEHDYSTGTGPRLDALLAMLKEADSGEQTVTEKGANKLKTGASIRAIHDGWRASDRTYAARMLDIAFESNKGDMAIVDIVHNYDDCRRSYIQHRGFIKPEVRNMLDLIFMGGATQKFDALLCGNYMPAEVVTENA